MSNPEFLVWFKYVTNELNRPSLTDYHLMRIASYIASYLYKKPHSIEDMRMKFDREERFEDLDEEEKQRRIKEVSAIGRARLARFSSPRYKYNGSPPSPKAGN